MQIWERRMTRMEHVCAVLYAIAACRNEASGLIMPNFVQIGQGVADIWPFFDFRDGGHPPSWIFKSWKF